jgi:AcrR family transcriptional regulator
VPKIVDRESRRSEIVAAYLRVVTREGMEQATSRALAAEAGMSTGALWHYFDNFDEVLFAAFRAVFDQTNERIAKAGLDKRGLDGLTAMLSEILPLGTVTHDEALIVVSLWGRVPSNPSLGTFQSQAEDLWRRLFVRYLAEAQEDGELSTAAPVDVLADTLIVLCIGQQVEHVLQTEVASPARQWTLVGTCLSPWAEGRGREHPLVALPAVAPEQR